MFGTSPVSEASPEAPGGIDWGALAHALAGISAVILGGLMYTRPKAGCVRATDDRRCGQCGVFFLEACRLGDGPLVGHGAVTGVAAGYLGWQWGFTLAYVTLWLAFIHFVIRGLQSLRARSLLIPTDGRSSNRQRRWRRRRVE